MFTPSIIPALLAQMSFQNIMRQNQMNQANQQQILRRRREEEERIRKEKNKE